MKINIKISAEEKELELLERLVTALEKIAGLVAFNKVVDNNTSVNFFSEVQKDDANSMESEAINEEIEKRSSIIKDFLEQNGITIKNIPVRNEDGRILDQIADFMALRFSSIKRVYELIKKNIQHGSSFSLSLKEYPGDVSDTCQLCTRLYNLTFLTKYRFLRSPQSMIYATPNTIGQVHNFFSGTWLERYVRNKIVSMVKSLGTNIKFSYLFNAEVILPSGHEFEFDILLEVEEEIYWFEVKTSDFHAHIEKYSKITDILKLDRTHVFLVLENVPEGNVKFLENTYGVSIIQFEKFADEFGKCLEKFKN
ncbi:MAG: hypothetical protein HQK76_10505 [Desulfobacterales bacterium]|nr:hypothetical protein [Desulfobacterales bacterium]